MDPQAATAPPIAGASPVAAGPPPMSVSQAMDILDQFHIKRSDYDLVEQALDVVTGEADDMSQAAPAPGGQGPPGADEQMAAELFAPDRNRKG